MWLVALVLIAQRRSGAQKVGLRGWVPSAFRRRLKVGGREWNEQPLPASFCPTSCARCALQQAGYSVTASPAEMSPAEENYKLQEKSYGDAVSPLTMLDGISAQIPKFTSVRPWTCFGYIIM